MYFMGGHAAGFNNANCDHDSILGLPADTLNGHRERFNRQYLA